MPPQDWSGLLLDQRYDVERPLGEGGMARVYLARDPRGKQIVVKVPKVADDLDAFRARFAREIKSMAAIAHPHVVRVLGAGEHEGHPYCLLEYLSGGSLRDRQADESQRKGLRNPARLSDWVPAIASALDEIHARGMVHRDVKPDNILFDAGGRPKLSDFGLAKLLARPRGEWATVQTEAGMMLGTPEYMAPEYIMDEGCDGRVDQYALAAICYELLAGRVPFAAGNPAAILVMQTTRAPRPLDDVNPAVNPTLAAAVLQGLSKDADGRFPTCADFAAAVLRDLSELPPERRRAATQPVSDANFVHTCPQCRTRLKVPENRLGTRVQCGKCGRISLVSDDAPIHVPSPASISLGRPGTQELVTTPSFFGGGRSMALIARERQDRPVRGN